MSAESTPHGVAPPGYRLPDTSHVGAVRLQVGDLQRSIDYYEQVIGLRTLMREGRTAALGPGPSSRALVWLYAKPGVERVPRAGAFGLYHFALLLPDRASLGRFVAHLGQHRRRFGAADHLVSEALYLTDPDGLGIEVYADRTRQEWQYSGSELLMTTVALNLEDVQRAGGALRWDGAPSDTVIGHVHLHVGSLSGAKAFYHSALGFDTTVWSYPGALFFAADGYHHHMGTNTWSRGPSATDAQARLLDWELRLPDQRSVDEAVRSLDAAGYPTVVEDGQRLVADPWGTKLRMTA